MFIRFKTKIFEQNFSCIAVLFMLGGYDKISIVLFLEMIQLDYLSKYLYLRYFHLKKNSINKMYQAMIF